VTKSSSDLQRKMDEMFRLSKSLAEQQPAFVTLAMHEYFRNLYPSDPYIKKRYSSNYLDNISICVEHITAFLRAIRDFGFYDRESKNSLTGNRTLEIFTQLWEKRFESNKLKSDELLYQLYQHNHKDISTLLSGKSAIDIGCGSGRFTVAMAEYCSSVIGVDINKTGIDVARRYAEEAKRSNVEFIDGDVLDLPFKEDSFDFCFSKGVLHHTGNLELGLREFMRVMRTGGAGFLYLYGSGGIYWTSRARMREVFKLIPKDIALKALDAIELPARRTIFYDSWYVPVEEYCEVDAVVSILRESGAKNVVRMYSHRDFELDTVVRDNPEYSEIWGNGEIRLHVEK
jgi:SAM-dependent methyltransferase